MIDADNLKPRKPCAACQSPASGQYTAGCRACALRNVARGPAFFESQRTGTLTPAYRKQLQALGDAAAVHKEVKAVAAALFAQVTA